MTNLTYIQIYLLNDIEAFYWDGVTDFTVVDEEADEKEAKERLDAFGDWLDNQDELPEEFQIKVES